MKIASIDIGTNSMRLLIADYENYFLTREKHINITRMGGCVDSTGKLTDEAIDRNIESLKDFAKKATDARVSSIYAMGTSALRDSKNKDVFLERARREVGLDVEIIKGSDEAYLGFMGVSAGISFDGYVLMIDIGGGSTEIVIGSEVEGIVYSKSIDIGALRLTEKFVNNDPPTDSDIRQMREYIKKQIMPEVGLIKSFEIKGAIGIGGTVTTVSAIAQQLRVYDADKVHNFRLKSEMIKLIFNKIVTMNQSQRLKLAGLQPQRADIITAGIVIVDEILSQLSIEELIISEYDNLEGLIYKKVLENSKS